MHDGLPKTGAGALIFTVAALLIAAGTTLLKWVRRA